MVKERLSLHIIVSITRRGEVVICGKISRVEHNFTLLTRFVMRKHLVELIGTFFLVLVIALSGNPLAIGLILMVMVYMGGHISGAHYNPAVSLGAWLSSKLSVVSMITYRIAQMIGALLAVLLAGWLTGVFLTPVPDPDVTQLQAVVVEAVFTFALVLVVLQTAMTKATAGNSYFGLAIGLTIAAAAFAGGPISGGAYNPAVGVVPLVFQFIQ